MAVAFDKVTEHSSGGADPVTFDHTPIGTPRGIVVLIMNNASSTDVVSSVTYGGVAMTRVRTDADTANEQMRTWVYFLGSSIPTGTQTVSIDATTTIAPECFCVSVTADGDTEVQDHDGVSENAANPQVTLSYGGKTCIAFGIIGSGLASTSSLTKLSGMSQLEWFDFGQQVCEGARQTTPGTSDFTYGYTASIDDVAMSVVAITESGLSTSPGAIALALAAVAPTVSPGNVNVSPGALALSAAAVAPRVDLRTDPTAVPLVLAPVAPTRMDQDLSPGANARVLTPVAPQVDQMTSPAAVAQTLSPIAPDNITSQAPTVDPAALALTATAVAPRVDQQADAGVQALTLAPVAPTRIDQAMTPAQLALALGIVAPTVSPGNVNVSPDALAQALTAVAPRVDLETRPDALGLALATVAPQIDLAILPGALALALLPVAPQVDSGLLVAPDALGLTVAPVAMARIDQTSHPGPLAVTLTPVGPRVDQQILGQVVGVTIATVAPRIDPSVAPGALSLTVGQPSPTVIPPPQSVSPAALAASLSILGPTIIFASEQEISMPAIVLIVTPVPPRHASRQKLKVVRRGGVTHWGDLPTLEWY